VIRCASCQAKAKENSPWLQSSPGQTLPCLFPDLPLEAALRYVNQVLLVPVVNRADCRNLEGVIASEAILKNYRG
jgi:hypothetical protein